ncbi:hypothetical protein evm_009631 [Chilo suppressalis]|nr:hypothetical protein evm_009631 [Chilo suppressalis]
MENVVALWLTLNGSAWGGGAWSLATLAVPADAPRVRLASDTVNALLHSLCTLENISLRCWVLSMQALAWITLYLCRKEKNSKLRFFLTKLIMDAGFVKAESTNLPSIDALMVGEFVALNPDFCSASRKNDKASMLVTYSIPAYVSASTENDSYLWHQRMAHLNFADLNKLSESVGVKLENTDKVICISCLERDRQQFPFAFPEGSRVQGKLELIHSDCLWSNGDTVLGGARYFLTLSMI